uniref:Uncharacterized protein n=1 Tax=Parascaris equorum TaxID=6256 RepID=A0A914RX20_PAREQ
MRRVPVISFRFLHPLTDIFPRLRSLPNAFPSIKVSVSESSITISSKEGYLSKSPSLIRSIVTP